MNPNRQIAVLLAQTAILAAFAAAELFGEPSGTLRLGLLALLALTTGLLISYGLRTRTALKQLTAELRRALDGNRKTRLLAKRDRGWSEAIFAINELLEELERIQIDAVRSQTARKRLLSGISHDIRTPLTSIIGYVDALLDGAFPSEQEKRDCLAIVSRKSNDLKALIDEIFTMAKLDADELPHKPELLDMAELARESVIAFLPELNGAGMELEIRIPDERLPVFADRLSLSRIIGNILKNACTYGQDGKTLGIGLEQDEAARTYKLLIWDCGPGIPKEELAYIFERTYRGDPSRNPGSGGSGLGLAIALALAVKNGGQLQAESDPWVKTTFSLTIPMYDMELQEKR
ncbi:HAMP domain-containing sensor histidine kinase [Paenibacillus sp. GYB004]|uniref:sensor histidine kinase n=1 Tax=Paenibacillus sp. GYB004 TaxID=2994393 RepID=UPI002F96C984